MCDSLSDRPADPQPRLLGQYIQLGKYAVCQAVGGIADSRAQMRISGGDDPSRLQHRQTRQPGVVLPATRVIEQRGMGWSGHSKDVIGGRGAAVRAADDHGIGMVRADVTNRIEQDQGSRFHETVRLDRTNASVSGLQR